MSQQLIGKDYQLTHSDESRPSVDSSFGQTSAGYLDNYDYLDKDVLSLINAVNLLSCLPELFHKDQNFFFSVLLCLIVYFIYNKS